MLGRFLFSLGRFRNLLGWQVKFYQGGSQNLAGDFLKSHRALLEICYSIFEKSLAGSKNPTATGGIYYLLFY